MSVAHLFLQVQLRQNINGGIYDNGRPLPTMYRDRILDLHHDGLSEEGGE